MRCGHQPAVARDQEGGATRQFGDAPDQRVQTPAVQHAVRQLPPDALASPETGDLLVHDEPVEGLDDHREGHHFP